MVKEQVEEIQMIGEIWIKIESFQDGGREP